MYTPRKIVLIAQKKNHEFSPKIYLGKQSTPLKDFHYLLPASPPFGNMEQTVKVCRVWQPCIISHALSFFCQQKLWSVVSVSAS